MSGSYDRAISVFSPDGRLLQVEYGQEAVKKGATCVAVKGKDVIVLGVEKKTALKLEDTRTAKKIGVIDHHVYLAFAGLNADARILLDKARTEAQSHRLTVEDPVTVEYITKYIAGIKQKYTQSGGVRPFGVSTLIFGFDPDDIVPRLYQTEPAGIYTAWKANAIGKSSKTVREFLETNFKDNMEKNEAIKLTIRSLLEVIQTGAKNMEVAFMMPKKKIEFLNTDEIETIIKEISTEKEQETARKKTS
ncbi:hypothetical protein PMAC_002648 [Pneumocystis sp. 'macacae']|nr:hypothetical protein PMAC_002648 [Pneumocystis sp. 'macacae']